MFQHVRIALPVLLLAGCGGSPSSSSPSTPSTPAAPTSTVSSVTVSGTSPALGESSQFTAMATLSTGTTQDVTGQATWQSSDAAVVSVSSAGVVRSAAAGEADVTATYSGVRGSQHVRVAAAVVAARTLTGVITDDSTGRPIVVEAEAQIMDGENAGKAGRVDANGRYAIPDLAPGTFMLRARATGYESRDHQVTLDVPEVRVDFALRAQNRDAPCSYAVTPDSIPEVGYVPGQVSVAIRRTSGSCAWSASTDASWIVLAGTTGNGDATLTFTYAANPAMVARSGSIRVDWTGGSASLTVRQARGDRDPCVAGITVGGQNPIAVPATAGQFTASIQVTAGISGACGPWTARAEPPDPVSFVGSTAGQLVPGSVTFTLQANTAPGTRTVYIVINFMQGNPSAVLRISQAGTP
jgi:Carboxypeptidase regulatory-like domain/Putative binding domain, N-terminal/Bacterial Ig-like domain (group 2)